MLINIFTYINVPTCCSKMRIIFTLCFKSMFFLENNVSKYHMMELLKISLVLLTSSCLSKYFVASHSYHFGQCPTLEPMADFSMENVSGIKMCKIFRF